MFTIGSWLSRFENKIAYLKGKSIFGFGSSGRKSSVWGNKIKEMPANEYLVKDTDKKEQMDDAIEKMREAEMIFNNCLDLNMIDSALYSRQSSERKLVSLINEARNEPANKDDAKLQNWEKFV